MGETRHQFGPFVRRFLADRSGATAIEYGLLVSLLGVVIATALGALGDKLYTLLNSTADKLNAAIS